MAALLALCCALAFLGSGCRPDRALVPYPPEVLSPMRQASDLPGGTPLDFRGNLSMGDKYNQSLAWDRITQDGLRAGRVPRWSRDLAGGVPFVPQMAQVYQPFNLLLLWLPAPGIYGIWWSLHLLLFGYFAYRFLRRIQVGHGAALFGMVALLLGLWTQARIHHNVMLTAVLPVFAMLSCTHHLFRHRGGLGHVALLALATGLSWLAGFAPGSLMGSYLVCGFAVALCLSAPAGQRLGPLLRFALAMGLGLTLASAQLLPVLRAAAETSRMPATLFGLAHRSLELPHLVTAIWPTLFAWPADHVYQGLRIHDPWPALAFLDKQLRHAAFNYPETAFYAGLAPLVIGLAGLRDRRTWYFAAAVGFGLAMAQGWLLPITRYLPGAHSGDVKRYLLLFGLGVPVLAAIGLDRGLTRWREGQRWRAPLVGIALLTLANGILLVWHGFADLQAYYGTLAERRLDLPPGAIAQWIRGYENEAAVNRAHLVGMFAVATGVGLVSLVALHLRRFAVPILCLVTAGELLWHGYGPVVAVPIERVATPPPILRPVLASTAANGVRPRLQRLLPPQIRPDVLQFPVWPNLASFWGAEDLATYNPLPKRRMEEFFLCMEPNAADGDSIVLGGAGVRALSRPETLDHPLADLIGIHWLISTEVLTRPSLEDHTPPDAAPPFRLYRRTTCLPRATFVGQAMILPDPVDRLEQLALPSHDPRRVVVLEDETAPRPDATPGEATVRIDRHLDESVEITVENPTAGYLRLADPYDDGWRATVDGEPTRIYIADHYLRAVFLSPGQHRVVFRYDGIVARGPAYLSLAALLSLVLLGVLGWRRRHASPGNAS